ncbi:MAG: ATP-binding protein [Planctomycetota bacterium]
MFRFRFFWKLFLSYALLILLTVGAVGVLVLGKYNNDLQTRTEASLRAQAVTLAEVTQDDFARLDPDELQRRIETIGADTGRRITLIRRDGTVVADTDAVAESMENHLVDRSDTTAALESGHGTDLRTSRTTGRETLYVSVCPDHADGRNGIVRIAVETASLREQERSVARLLLFGVGLATLLALLLGAFMVRRISRPLEQMREVAGRLGGGDYSARVALERPPHRGDELGELASALNRLGFDMSQRVADLTAGQERLRAMVAGMIEGVVAVDEDDRVTFSNYAARRLLKFEREDMGKPLWENAKVAGLDALLVEARRSDSAATCELEMSTTDEDAIVRAQAHRFNDGDSVGVVIVLNDISEIRRLERIRRDFVANVSHELKTPLTSIRGYVEALLDGALEDDDNNVRFLEKVENNVLRLNHLVTDLLSLARIESQAGLLPRHPFDLHALVGEAVRRHESTAQGRDQRLVLDACDGALQVLGDREALTQIIDNLVDNALKYTPDEGEVTVRVGRDGDRAILEVADNGIGIPAEDQARIFERFYRVDKARSRAVGGTGLGLSIVKHLVQSLNGTLELQSEPGVGSTFRVTLDAA